MKDLCPEDTSGQIDDAKLCAPIGLSIASQGGRRCRELQNFRARRDVEDDTTPFAVETGKDGTQTVIWNWGPQLHRQAAERAVRVRSVGVHAPSHRLVWLTEGKRQAEAADRTRLLDFLGPDDPHDGHRSAWSATKRPAVERRTDLQSAVMPEPDFE